MIAFYPIHLILCECVCFTGVSLFFLAPGPVHGVGLVYLPGRLWPAKLKVPESEPSHCPGSTGEVRAPLHQLLSN